MKPRELPERVQRILDRLSDRIDTQAMRVGADAPHLVSTVGVFHTLAGGIERHPSRDVRDAAARLRMLRRIVRTHAVMVALRRHA